MAQLATRPTINGWHSRFNNRPLAKAVDKGLEYPLSRWKYLLYNEIVVFTFLSGCLGSGSSLNSNMAPQVAAPLYSGPHFDATHFSKHDGKFAGSVSIHKTLSKTKYLGIILKSNPTLNKLPPLRV